ncbi:hypothetical protein OPS25_13835 [Alteromonas ponticola]|uniref:Uncharacterized protein n=1 Tax=Alteromonas aquimaris TaxID=2998417 RepID=A0ABT3P9Y1_9ALTE|nr:hypothetical protein [Alteromonas aquimaris]MCW8109585.1 hypothetical protein [Alteromonas aquimaris]
MRSLLSCTWPDDRMTTVNPMNLREKMSCFMPVFMAWVFSCLIMNASFATDNVSEQPAFSKSSPVVQYNYTSKSHSLRWTGTTLDGIEQADTPDLIPPWALVQATTVVSTLALEALLHGHIQKHYRPIPRGPPILLP